MDFIALYGYDVREGKSEAYQQWLADVEDEWRAAMPEGTEYVGTYAAVHTSEKNAGQMFTIYRLDSYAAQDRLAEASKGGVIGKLMTDSLEYITFGAGSGWSNILLKSMSDAAVWG